MDPTKMHLEIMFMPAKGQCLHLSWRRKLPNIGVESIRAAATPTSRWPVQVISPGGFNLFQSTSTISMILKQRHL